MADIQKLKAMAEAVRDLEDDTDKADEHAEAKDALWLHMHCHTLLDLIAEIERLKHEKRTGDQACRSGLARERIFTSISMALIQNHPHERMGMDWDYEHPLHDLIIGLLTERDQIKAENDALRENNDKLTRRNGMLEENVKALSATHVRYTWLRKKVDQPYNDFVSVTQNIGHDWIVVHDLDRAVDQMIGEEQP